MTEPVSSYATLAGDYILKCWQKFPTHRSFLPQGHHEIKQLASTFFPVRHTTFETAAGIGDLFLSCMVGRGQQLAAAFVQA